MPNRSLTYKSVRYKVTLFILVFAVLGGILLLFATHAATPYTAIETEQGTLTTPATVFTDSMASGGKAVQFGNTPSNPEWPDASNRPHMISSTVMAYTDANGVAQQVTLKPLPAPGSNFGPNNCAFYDARGWINAGANCMVDGYNFNGVGVGNIQGSNVTISRNWFHNIDGQDSWAIWCHDNGSFTKLTVTDNLAQGTTGVGTAVITGLLKVDGPITNVIAQRNHVLNAGSFVQFAPISGAGAQPYGNIVADNYAELITDGGSFGFHNEQVNVSSGTGGLLIQHNHLTGPTGQTATIYISHDSGNVGNITIDNNLLDGYPQNTIYSGNGGAAQGVLISTPQNVKITNNRFANTNGQNAGGLVIEATCDDPRLMCSGNVWYPSLSPIPGM